MPYFMIYSSLRRDDGKGLDWFGNPVGVFKADDADEACKTAARKRGSFGTYFAVEGYPWGIEMLDAPAGSELGAEPDEVDELQSKIRELERRVGVGPDALSEGSTAP